MWRLLLFVAPVLAASLAGGAYRALVVRPEHEVEWGVRLWVFVIVAVAVWYFGGRPRDIESGRRERGLCAKCGYDLRATPERCPECGTVPPAEAVE